MLFFTLERVETRDDKFSKNELGYIEAQTHKHALDQLKQACLPTARGPGSGPVHYQAMAASGGFLSVEEARRFSERQDLEVLSAAELTRLADEEKVRFKCPHCGKEVNAPQKYAGKRGKCPRCQERITVPGPQRTPPKKSASAPEPTGYGMIPSNPVMTGMGPRGAARYLRHLRCPAGRSVSKSRRTGSIRVADQSYVNRNGGKPDPALAMSRESQEYVNVDIYEVACDCGDHEVTLYMDMYHIGADRCIGAEDWRFV